MAAHCTGFCSLFFRVRAEFVAALMQVGFGELASSVITESMSQAGELDPNARGHTVLALYAVCAVPNFAQICAALQGDTTLFLNELAKLLHDEVAASGGSVNKNLGHSFVFVRLFNWLHIRFCWFVPL
jgi:hypothetical protein